MPAETENAPSISPTPAMPKSNSDSKNTHLRKERTEVVTSITTTPAAVATTAAMAPKQSQQHPKPHTQQLQQQRHFISNRQNQEEAVFKMVQNIFKLLETRECTISICLSRRVKYCNVSMRNRLFFC